jgi:hypothetical protein
LDKRASSRTDGFSDATIAAQQQDAAFTAGGAGAEVGEEIELAIAAYYGGRRSGHRPSGFGRLSVGQLSDNGWSWVVSLSFGFQFLEC